MLLKFNNFINEGLWKSGVKRSQTGDLRTEDMFSQKDLHIFDFPYKKNLYNDFLKKYNIYDICNIEFEEKLIETYEDFMTKYANQHGLLDFGFGEEDKCNMPDFDWSFKIPDIKNVTVHISYSDKKINILCGNDDKHMIDISETSFGRFIKENFENLPANVFYDNKKIVLRNLNLNWEDFKKTLSQFLYERFCDVFEGEAEHGSYHFSDIEDAAGAIEPYHDSKELRKYLFNGVIYNFKNKKDDNLVMFGQDGEIEIQDTQEGQDILKIYSDEYDTAYSDTDFRHEDDDYDRYSDY